MKTIKSSKESRLNVKRLLILVLIVIIIAAAYYWYSQSNLIGLSNYLFSQSYLSNTQKPVTFITANLSNSTSTASFGVEQGNTTTLTEAYIYENNTLINCEYGANYSQGQLCSSKSINNGTTLFTDAINSQLANGDKFIVSVYMNKTLNSQCTAIGYDGDLFIRAITNSSNATIEVPGTTNADICNYQIYLNNGTYSGSLITWPSQQAGQYTIITRQNKSG
jgi:uncharacterized protein YxeA